MPTFDNIYARFRRHHSHPGLVRSSKVGCEQWTVLAMTSTEAPTVWVNKSRLAPIKRPSRPARGDVACDLTITPSVRLRTAHLVPPATS
ncbi:uncharacterized protein SEPMUDRAFT_151014 [Sphaerulina musiva SO2202]|uniref:Uncharacterized protein n=1 Tax=Sphaerulina musiva (strain SO2202) TaxID=692275 RepID=M3CBX3_SPHMS|nr:uncharacterized protein SEPMUDRAFT_151014 [Sphaerulina musiva SO2202]EMF09912.1 hypothetical protein SEPMUDRAFT_151014 [Sphaerulina musiva SO2202]